MAFTYGFYNSENHDRVYDAVQFGSIFDGVIKDGVFEHYGKAFLLKDTGGVGDNVVIIQPGRAWFNHTWTFNDADYALEMPAPELVLNRIDAVVLRMDDNARENTVQVIQGTPSSNPEKPLITNNGPNIWDYPLAYITRHADNPKIRQADIENAVGTSACPFSTGLIDGVTTDQLIAQWSAQWEDWTEEKRQEFIDWFDNIQYVLDGDVAGHLQNEIDNLSSTLSNYQSTTNGQIETINGNITALSQRVANNGTNLTAIEQELTANGNRIYMDYKNGKYGYNTSASRGADTFHPFSNFTGAQVYRRVDYGEDGTYTYRYTVPSAGTYLMICSAAASIPNPGNAHIINAAGGFTKTHLTYDFVSFDATERLIIGDCNAGSTLYCTLTSIGNNRSRAMYVLKFNN